MNAYVISLIIAIIALLVAIVASNSVDYGPSPNSGDVTVRRIWFWVMGVLTPIISWVICYFLVYGAARGKSHKADAMQAMCIAAAVSFLLYLAVGWVLSKVFNKQKIGTWFYSKK